MFLITGSDIGGAEIVTKNIIFNLDKDRFDIIFVSIRPLGQIGREIGEKVKAFSLGASEKFNPLFIWRLWLLLIKNRPDILHCHLFHANFIGRIIGKLAGVKFIISTVHSDNFGGKLRYFLLKISDKLNNMTVSVSENIKNGLIEKKITTPNKIKVIYNGVAEPVDDLFVEDIIELKEELGLVGAYPIILSVGRLNIIKGHIYLIRALKSLENKYEDIKLILIGGGPERLFLENEVKKLGLISRVLFLGAVSNPGLYYKLADLFVLPSVNEGFGLAAVEAMSNKLLVVASNVGGIPEIIKDGENGFMSSPGNSEDLSLAIINALSLSKDKKSQIIEKARCDAANKFSLKRMLNDYNLLYN